MHEKDINNMLGMPMKSTSGNTPLEIYHGVPKGWTKDEIVATYKLLGGRVSIETPIATEPGAPSCIPDR